MTPDDPIDAASTERANRLRAMNEQIRERRIAFEGTDLGIHAIMCECVDPGCAAMLQVADDDLQTARSSEDWYVVDPDHVGPARIVARSNSHYIVELP